jgi:hypothetical protein
MSGVVTMFGIVILRAEVIGILLLVSVWVEIEIDFGLVLPITASAYVALSFIPYLFSYNVLASK